MPRRAGRRRCLRGVLLGLALALAHPAFGQPPGSADQPPAPGQPPVTGETPTVPVLPPTPTPTPVPAPVPVIPEVQQIGPPATVPSAPQRVLPPVTVGLPVTATFQLEPSVTFIEEYSDNFNLTRRDRQSNFRSGVSPGLRLGINSPLTKGLIAYAFSPTHDSSTDEILYFHSLLGQIVWQANPRWQLTLADTFTRSDQRAEADRLGLRQERQTFTTNTFALTSDYLIGTVATRQAYRLVTFSDENGGKTTTHALAANAAVPLYQTNQLSAGYEYLTTESSGGTSTGGGQLTGTIGDFSLQGHQVTAAVNRQISSSASVGLKTSYALRHVTNETDDSDFQLWNVSLFNRYALIGRLSLDGSLGVSGLMTGSRTLGPHLFSATSLSYQFARALLTVAVDRGFSETFAEGENFGVVETEGVTGTLTYRFIPSLTGVASGFYRRNKFTGVANEAEGNEDGKNWGGSLALSWRILRNVLVDLTYTYVEQVSGRNGRTATGGGDRDTDQGGGYIENRVQAAIRVTF